MVMDDILHEERKGVRNMHTANSANQFIPNQMMDGFVWTQKLAREERMSMLAERALGLTISTNIQIIVMELRSKIEPI